MAWQYDYQKDGYRGTTSRTPIDSLSLNEQCFIRKDHKCGKLFHASKSCFIACPTDNELEPILGLMSEKLMKFGIEPIIAIKERAYGQDIFCTKICGKIIESRFCIVILDDTIENGKNIPNPNVYYEYGLMTSLNKHIIPLQKEKLKLAFNIQSYDTIKYSPKNIASELDRAIKDAIRITKAEEGEKKETSIQEKTILRKFEVAGLKIRGNSWYFNDAIGDTDFKGFGQYEKLFYAYVAKIDDPSEFQGYFEDLGVILFRTEKKIEEIENDLTDLKKKMAVLKEPSIGTSSLMLTELPSNNSLPIDELEIKEIESALYKVKTFFIGFIIQPGINADAFISNIKKQLNQFKRYKLCWSSNNEILFGDIKISFADPIASF